MVPGKPYPKLSLPTKRPAAQASPRPASKPAILPTLYDITKQEVERAGEGVARTTVLDVVMGTAIIALAANVLALTAWLRRRR